MNDTKQNATSCVQALQVFASPVYQAAQPLILIVDLCAIVANVVLSLSFARARSYNVNVRILVPSRAIACVVASMGQLFKVLNTWLSTGTTDCLALLATFNDCTVKQVIVTAYLAIVFGGVVIAIDRTIATYRHATYENMKWYIGAGAALLAWIVAITVEAIGKGKPYIFVDNYSPFCSGLSDRTNYVMAVTTSIELVLTLATTYVFFKLSAVSRRKIAAFAAHQQHLTLTSRLQLKHNIELTRTLLPSEVLHGVVWVVDLAAYLITVWVVDPSLFVIKFIYWPYVELWVASYMLAQPLMMIRENEKVRVLLRENARSMISCCLAESSRADTVVVGIHEDTPVDGQDSVVDARNQRAHFDLLRNSWLAVHQVRHA